jgi:hypothetical protein
MDEFFFGLLFVLLKAPVAMKNGMSMQNFKIYIGREIQGPER